MWIRNYSIMDTQFALLMMMNFDSFGWMSDIIWRGFYANCELKCCVLLLLLYRFRFLLLSLFMISDSVWSSINRSVVYLILVCFIIKLQIELWYWRWDRSSCTFYNMWLVQTSKRQVSRRQPESIGTWLIALLMNVLPSPNSFISLQASGQT